MGACPENIDFLFGSDTLVLEDSLPLGLDTINKHCATNAAHGDAVVKFSLENSRLPLKYVWQYLAHTQIQFYLPEFTAEVKELFLAQDLWFNKNNISYSLFNAEEELTKEIIFNSSILLRKAATLQAGSSKMTDFFKFPLACVAILNFQEKIIQEHLNLILEANEVELPELSQADFLLGRYVLKKLNPESSLLLRVLGIEGD